MNRDPKRKRTGIAPEFRLSPSTVHTRVGNRRAVKANILIFESKAKEDQEAKHSDSGVEVFSWFEQQCSRIRHAAKVSSIHEKVQCARTAFETTKKNYLSGRFFVEP